MKKTVVEKHFDKIARDYDYYKSKNSFYYKNLKKLLGNLIPKGKKVFEVGCGTGDLLASLHPKIGYGFDISSEMIGLAKTKYKNKKSLKFFSGSQFTVHGSLDAIFMSDVIEHLEDPKDTFRRISGLMDKHSLPLRGKETVFVCTMANPIWEPVLMLAERLGLKMPEGKHNRIRYSDLRFMIQESGMKIVKHDYKLLIPINIPIITGFVNRYLEKYFKKFAFIEYFTAVIT